MKIVIATPILFDKTSPFNHLFHDILEGFLQARHRVTRLVAVETETDTGYDLGIRSDAMEYIPVKRQAADHGNIISRYIKDSLTNWKMARKLRKVKDADVLFEDVSYSSWLVVRAAKKKGMRVVAMLQDVWPDNAVQSGLLREGSLLYRSFEIFQRYVYKNADSIICISDDMKVFIASKGVPEEKISVIYNWGYTDEIVDISWEENAFVNKFDLDNDLFYAIYAGNIGRMQNVELVLQAAELLRSEARIKFLIIGAGAREAEIKQMAKEMELPNVTFLPFQPAELATSIYSAAGVNLIPLVPGGIKTALPSKTGVCLSCGQPIVFAFGADCRFAQMVESHGACVCVSAKDSEEMANAIRTVAAGERKKDYSLYHEKFVKVKNVEGYVGAING